MVKPKNCRTIGGRDYSRSRADFAKRSSGRFCRKIANADQIVIGASIRYGHFNPLVYQFVEQHYPALNAKKTAFTV